MENSDGVYVIPSFTGLGAPYWNQNARGSVFGLTRGTSKEDFIKATLQSIAYQVRDIIDTMQVDAQTAIQVLKVDGGAAMNNFLMQFQADILGIDIARAKNLETTALGRKNPSEPSSPNKGPLPDTPSPRADKIRANGQRPSVRRELGDIRVFLRQRDDARAQLPRMPVKIKRMERTR